MLKLIISKALLSLMLVVVLAIPVKALPNTLRSYVDNNAIVHNAPSSVDGVESELGYVGVGVSLGSSFSQAQKWQDHFCATSEICALGDVNGDKKADIIKFVRTDNGPDDSDVYVALSSGTDFGAPQKWQDYFCTLDEICEVGDVNGDGKADIIAFERANNFGDQGVVRVALSTGASFVADEPYKNVWASAFCVLNDFCSVGDVNGDGKADIITFTNNGIYVALSLGAKFDSSQKWSDSVCLNGKGCLISDVNGDGKADVIKFVGSISGPDDSNVYVLISSGSQFSPSQNWLGYFCTLDEVCAAGDINGDGKADIVAFERANNFGDQGVVRVALSTSTSFVADEPYKNVWAEAFCVLNDFCAVGDVTGDGKADIVNFSRFNWPETRDENFPNDLIAAFKDKFYRFSYKSDNTILQSSSIDGRTWSDYLETSLSNVKSIQTTASSLSSFCLLGYNTSDQPFTACTSDPDVGWSNPSVISNFDFTSPDMTYFQGRFYVVGHTQSNQIAISSSSDGVQWTQSRLINSVDTTRNYPVIAGSNDKLCVAWLTSNFTGLIAISCTDNPDSDWPSGLLVPNVTKLNDTSTSGSFGFAYLAGRFLLAWGTEADANECRFAGCKMPTLMAQSVDGSNWTPVVKYNVLDGGTFYDIEQIEHTNQRVCMLTLTGIADGARYAISCRPIPAVIPKVFLPTATPTEMPTSTPVATSTPVQSATATPTPPPASNLYLPFVRR